MILHETRRVRLEAIDPDATLALLAGSGLVGHGGGGFPVATKIAAARGRGADLIVNGCDGEPLVAKDTLLLQRASLLVADGIAIVQRLLRPRRTLLAVHEGSAGAAAARRLAKLPGLALMPVPPRYVSSEGSALASLARGGEARPVDHPLPLTEGFPSAGKRPTVVLNVETVARVAAAVLRGQGTPTRLLSVAGDVHAPQVVEVETRTTVAEVVALGGPVAEPQAVLLGGYGGRWFEWDAVRGLTVAELGRDVGAGLVMVHGRGCPLAKVDWILDYLAGESAGQCGPCMFGLPAIAADWHQLLDPASAPAAEIRLRQRLPVIAGRGACAHPDGAVTMAGSASSVFARDLAAHRQGLCVRQVELAGAAR